jgi:hypothetical protein
MTSACPIRGVLKPLGWTRRIPADASRSRRRSKGNGSPAAEYDGIEYSSLPVKVAVFAMKLCSNMFQLTSVTENDTANVRGAVLPLVDTLF